MPPPPDASPNAFDVYNRSSGAAWSMAARAYFRRGDQDLPRRGTFHYEGTQVLTGGRARAAAAAAAASAAASQSTAWAPSAAPAAAAAPAPAAEAARPSAYAGVSRDARQIQRARESFRRRLNATAWPSLRERLFYASLAWIPVAIAIGYGAASVTGCDVASVACPPNLETMQTIAIAISLGLLVALPRVAYVAALASLGALVVGIVVVGAVALLGVQQPVPASATMLIVGSLVLGYAATAAVVLLRDPSTKPWAPASQSIPR